MRIHTIGDSHSYFGWTDIVNHHLGPLLCYSFGKDPVQRCNIRSFGIQSGDVLIFCLGEIDCRCHIHKYVSNRNYQDIIKEIVEDYFKAIYSLTQSMNITVCVYNIVPPVIKSQSPQNPQFPHLGTDEERRQYVLYFNEQLREKCSQYGYIFFDVYDKYVNSEGFLSTQLSDGLVHIKNGKYISEFIDNHILPSLPPTHQK